MIEGIHGSSAQEADTHRVAETAVVARPRANVRVHLVNPESGYESETEAKVTSGQWAVIDAVLCGREQPYAAAHELLDALSDLLAACESDFGIPDEGDEDDEPVGAGVNSEMAVKFGHLRRARAAIAKATGAA